MSVYEGERDSLAEQDERWYTVRQAADYLGVSQPTIFRWMKDGTLSFYKVGNATRFSRDGLDAVVKKTTGRREAEAVRARCMACGHEVLVEGGMQSTGQIYFRPEKTKFWTFLEAMVPLKAKVCTACGYIQIHADTDKLTRLMPEEKNEPAS